MKFYNVRFKDTDERPEDNADPQDNERQEERSC